MEGVYQDLNDFDKRMKSKQPLEDQRDSSSEEENEGSSKKFSTEADILKEKNRILMEKLFKSDKQLNEYREVIDSIHGGKSDHKDKKIIELAKKNRALQLSVESLKTKAAKAAEFALTLKKDSESKDQDNHTVINSTMMGSVMGGQDLEKKVKDLEKRVTKMRNENQHLSGQVDKATKILEREVGEVINIDEMAKEDASWKGRAQKIDLLQNKVKKLKAELKFQPGLSVISETMSEYSNRPPMSNHVDKAISKLESNKNQQLEKVQKELEETTQELAAVKTKFKASVARRDTLEQQTKDSKVEFNTKMKILLEKTENDNLLIERLKLEVKKLEQTKGVKSGISKGDDETVKLRTELAKYKNSAKCLEIELEQKEDKIRNLLTNCVGAPDEQLEEKELRIAELEEKVEELEKEKFQLKQGQKQGKFSQPPSGVGRDESDKLVKELSQQNAILRRKLDDAMEKLELKQK